MYKAKQSIGTYAVGDDIPKGYLSAERAKELLEAGAIEAVEKPKATGRSATKKADE